MEKIFNEKPNLIKLPKIGDIVEGIIIGSGQSSVFVDLGNLGTGIIYGREFYESKETLKKLKVGDKIFAKVVDLENEEGYVELSLKEASDILGWQTLQEKKEKNETIPVKILKANKGGLMAELFGIQAFLPVSQLSQEHYPRIEGGDTTKILRELQKFIGQEFEVKILDLDQKEKKLILSEKAKDTEKINELLKKYKKGDTVEGEITGVVDFGAFMRFGENLEGLIHISELDWQIIENPADIVKIGDKIKAKIIDIADGRVFLSLKALKKDPWKEVEKKYKKGDVVKGKATKLNPFGAFVQLTPKIQGLCHISEFGTQKKMTDTLKIGETYNFEILLIDSEAHRMSLKLVEK